MVNSTFCSDIVVLDEEEEDDWGDFMNINKIIIVGYGLGLSKNMKLVDEELKDEEFQEEAPKEVIKGATGQEDLNIDFIDEEEEEGRTEALITMASTS